MMSPTKIYLVLFCLFSLIACEESGLDLQEFDTDNEFLNADDPEMEEALLMAEEYLSKVELSDNQARKKKKKEKDSFALTVLRFKNNQLQYKTNRRRGKYKTIGETTVTADVELGEYIFWSAGGQLSDLDGIEFDPESRLQLVDAPE